MYVLLTWIMFSVGTVTVSDLKSVSARFIACFSLVVDLYVVFVLTPSFASSISIAEGAISIG